MRATRSSRLGSAIKQEEQDEAKLPLSSFGTQLDQFVLKDNDKSPHVKDEVQSKPHSTRHTPVKRSTCTNTHSPSPTKRRKTSSKYAAPEVYAHLPALQDRLAPNLICIFVGTNPGIRTAEDGHAYAHPSNLFWKLLHSSGCTDRRCHPSEDVHLPELYSMGNTNIVERPTRDAAELSRQEMAAGTPILEAKIALYRPEAVCIVGKGIWEAIWRYRYGKNPTKEQFRYGWQDEKENMGRCDASSGTKEWRGARVFVTASTSGLSASLKPPEKAAIWLPFGQWVKQRRAERQGQNQELKHAITENAEVNEKSTVGHQTHLSPTPT